jgi:hypothetical protein
VKELRGFITIFGKRLDLVEETIRKTDARLSNKIAYLGESFGETGNNGTKIKKKYRE